MTDQEEQLDEYKERLTEIMAHLRTFDAIIGSGPLMANALLVRLAEVLYSAKVRDVPSEYLENYALTLEKIAAYVRGSGPQPEKFDLIFENFETHH